MPATSTACRTANRVAQLVLGYAGHNLALLLAPVALALLALALVPRWRKAPRALLARAWSPGPNPAVNGRRRSTSGSSSRRRDRAAARRAGLRVYLKTDWGISLFFLTPLALVAIPALRLPKMALVNLAAIWLVVTLATLAAAPYIAAREWPTIRTALRARRALATGPRTDEAWHQRFGSRWAVVAGTTEIGEPMTFYSPDHPAPFTPGEIWSSGLTSLEEAKRLGFIGICDTTDWTVAGLRRLDGGERAERRASRRSRRSASSTAIPVPSVTWKSTSCRRRNRD